MKKTIFARTFLFALIVFISIIHPAGIVKVSKIQVAGSVTFKFTKSLPSNVVTWKATRYFIDETTNVTTFAADTLSATGDTAQFNLQKTTGYYSFYKIYAYEAGKADSVVVQVLNAGVVQKYLYINSTYSSYAIPVWVVIPSKFTVQSKFIMTMHGQNRDASGIASDWMPFANTNNYVVAAPEFNDTDWSTDDYNLGNMFTNSSYTALNPKSKWTFNIVEQIHRELYAACSLIDSTYELWGHSAGGQFVHRLAFFLPDSLITRYIAGNSGWYSCPDSTVAFPWGTINTQLNISKDDMIAFTNRNLIVMRGTADTVRDGVLNIDPNSDAQGLNRYARAGYFYNKGISVNSGLKWKLIDVQGVGHDDQDMALAAGSYIITEGTRYAVATGNWTDAIWSISAGGIAGSSSTPTSVINVIINPNVTVTINTSAAECNSVSFAATTSKIGFAANSVLSVYGDFNLVSSAKYAFSTWATGAKLKFTGYAATQSINGLSTSKTNSSQNTFYEIVVDKPLGRVITPGTNDYTLMLGRSLEIINGTFELGDGDDIIGYDAGTVAAAKPTITIQTGGTLSCLNNLYNTYIRSGLSGTGMANPIGKFTIAGTVNGLSSGSSNGMGFSGVDVLSGGTLNVTSGWGSVKCFGVGTLTIYSGGTFRSSTTSTLWPDAAIIRLNSGGTYIVTAVTAYICPTFSNSGTFVYSRTSAGDQTIADINYTNLQISSSGNNKNWKLSTSRTISGTLTIDTGATFNYYGAALTLGNATHTINGSIGVGKTLINNGTLVFGYSSTLIYNDSTAAQTTSNVEFPSANGPTNLAINNAAGVTLHASRTVNDLSLFNGTLTLGANDLIMKGSIIDTPGVSSMVITSGSGQLKKIISAIPATFTFPIGTTSKYSPVKISLTSGSLSNASIGVKVAATKNANNTSVTNYLNRTWTITGSGITNPVHTDTLFYSTADVAGTESNLIGGLYTGTTWSNLGSVNVADHFISGKGLTSFGDVTAGEASAFINSETVSVKVIPQGFYNSSDRLNATDTIHVYLANSATPFSFVDSAKVMLDSVSFTANAMFNNAASGNYYIVVKHRNSVETWSASVIVFAKRTTISYDFTDAQTKTFQNNAILVSSSPVRWAMYSGDCNQDGYIDPLDISIIDQDSFNYRVGIGVSSDINGDHFVDPLDMAIADLNSFNYVGVKKPLASKTLRVDHRIERALKK